MAMEYPRQAETETRCGNRFRGVDQLQHLCDREQSHPDSLPCFCVVHQIEAETR